MSYLVLARKYRPHRFEEVVGQEPVVQALTHALTRQRLHHAYLFTGTRGVGKTTVSRILAKSLNCTGLDGQGAITASPCGQCPACRDIDAGRFVDYTELDAASNRGVDEISQLLDQSVYKPVVGRFKVYMIDEVHMLSTTAFNAMLKTLEEPPEYLKFVLATTDPQKVPVTVLSRCLQFNLRPMVPTVVAHHLTQVLSAEHIEAEPGAVRALAKAARGSMRDALSLADQAIAFGAGALKEAVVAQMLGLVDEAHALGLIEALIARDGAALVAGVDRLRQDGLSALGALETMAAAFQTLAIAQVAAEALDRDDRLTQALAPWVSALPADELQLYYSMALHGRSDLELAPDEYSGLVMVVLRMLAYRPQGTADRQQGASAADLEAPSLEDPRGPLSSGANRVDSEPSAPPEQGPVDVGGNGANNAASSPVPTGTATAGGGGPRDEGHADNERWQALVQSLQSSGAITGLARELAVQAACVAVDPQGITWRLAVERETLRRGVHVEKLQQAVSRLQGERVVLEVVKVECVQDSVAQREEAQRAQRQASAELEIRNDPGVQALMTQFKTARIVPGSIKPR